MSTAKKSSSKNNRRRFNDDQIKSLETMFEAESRPELRLKQHLANKLGLQPRQVAIWFQNKRARSKSKQIEQEYRLLKADYDELASQFEKLRKENQALLVQLQRLKKIAEKRDAREIGNENQMKLATSGNTSFLLEMNNHDPCKTSCNDLNGNIDYLQETAVFNMAQIANSPLAGPEKGCSFESCTIFDNTGCTQWWDL